ncbi:MAG: DNA-binding NarL/FixJ family response regulator [Crocinitomicaceae bacterium]
MKVLIVEDEMLIAIVTKMQLQDHGFEVVGIASNEETFWPLMKNGDPTIILMDVKLKKNESGIDLAKQIKEQDPELPIIFTTGNSRKFIEQEIEGISNTRILIKPLYYPDLFDAIKSLLNVELR